MTRLGGEPTAYRKDRGLDALIDSVGVQCKLLNPNYKTSWVSGPQMREFLGALWIAGAEHGFYVTTGWFSEDAKESAREAPIPVKLIDHDRVLGFLSKSGLE